MAYGEKPLCESKKDLTSNRPWFCRHSERT